MHMQVVLTFVVWIPFVSSKVSNLTITTSDVVKHSRKKTEKFCLLFRIVHSKRFRLLNDDLMRMFNALRIFFAIQRNIPQISVRKFGIE